MVKELGKNEILEKLNMDNLYSIYYADTQEELENYIEEELGLFLEDSGDYWRGSGEYTYNGFTNALSTLKGSIEDEYEGAFYNLEYYDLETKKEILEHRYNEVEEVLICEIYSKEFDENVENDYYSQYNYLDEEGYFDKFKRKCYEIIPETINTVLMSDSIGELYYEVYAVVVK